MRKMVYDREKLHLAEVKYFDIKHNGIELTDTPSFVVIYGEDKHYVNALCPYEEFPTFRRVGVPNYNNNTCEYYGSKIVQLTEECSTGACWVIASKNDFAKKLPEQVSYQELERYVMDSPLFFKDRTEIAKERFRKMDKPLSMLRVISKDQKGYEAYCQYFDSRSCDLRREFVKIK